LSALRRRNLGQWNRQRLVLAAVVVLATVALEHVPAAALVAIIAVSALGLVTYERIRFGKWRRSVLEDHS
jgi:MFS superfamily sulfate permease-like transporter